MTVISCSFSASTTWLSNASSVDLISNALLDIGPGTYEVQVYYTAPNSETVFLGNPFMTAGGGSPNTSGTGFPLVPNKLYSFNVTVGKDGTSTCYATSTASPVDSEPITPIYVMAYLKG